MSLSLSRASGAGLGPVAPAHFQVAAVLGIVRVPFDQFKELNRPIQRGMPAESLVIFSQGVDVKRLAVNFFGIVHHASGVIQPPKRAAVLRVPKPVHDEIQRAVGHLLEELFGPGAVDGGKRPKNAAVDDKPLGLRAVGLEIIGQPAHPAALLVVQRRSAPERHDLAVQLAADTLRKFLQFICIHEKIPVAGYFGIKAWMISTRPIWVSPVSSIFRNFAPPPMFPPW